MLIGQNKINLKLSFQRPIKLTGTINTIQKKQLNFKGFWLDFGF